MQLPKSKPTFFFKGFPEDCRFKSHTTPESVAIARGTLYEAWFRALKVSPFYPPNCSIEDIRSDHVQATYDRFGDLSEIDFGNWWQKTGYQLFAETSPFRRIELSDGKDDSNEQTPTLKLEIPLNVSPATLKRQFEVLLQKHHPHYKDFDRWEASTAPMRLQSRKLTSLSINLYLDVYAHYLKKAKEDGEDNVRLYEICEELALNPKLKITNTDRPSDVQDKRLKMSLTVSEYLEKAKNLCAHAAEGRFPCTDNHQWIERKKRSARIQPKDEFDSDLSR